MKLIGQCLALLLLATFPAVPLSQTQLGAEPEEEAGLPPDLLEGLRERSRVYRRAVLQFSSHEQLLEENLKAETGELSSRHDSGYRYLLQANPDGLEVTEYREIVSRSGVPVRNSPVVVQTLMPPPYLWSTLFDQRNESHFRFHLLGTERRGVTDTLVIAFDGLRTFDQGAHIAEWSGRIWMDRDRLIPLRVEAVPARQEEVLKAKLDRYRKAFQLGGVRMRSRPRAFILAVDFLVSRYGLNFPSQTTWRRQVVDAQGLRGTEKFVKRRYEDYRFINIRTEEILGEVVEDDNPS